MPQQNPSSKHHYIPAFYLSRWAGKSDGKLIEFTNPFASKIKTKPVGPKAAGFEEGLYSLEGYEPELAQQVEEHFFKPVDDEASKALRMLESFGHRAPWDSKSRSAWTRFILSLLLRCPEDIKSLRGWWRDEVYGNTVSQDVQDQEHPERFSEFLGNQPVAMKERSLFKSLYALIDNETIGSGINLMEWRVLERPSAGPTFLTSDRPVIRTSSLSGAGAHIALPISPELLFIASPDIDFLNSILEAPQIKLVDDINRQIVEGAQRYVYGCDDSQLQCVKNRFGMNPQPRLFEEILKKATDRLPPLKD